MTDSNDLDAFFNQKKAKKNKKAAIQDVNSLAKKLEKTVKKQEELDREEEERKLRIAEQEQHNFIGNEDSDWHDYVDPRDVDMSALGGKVKDMELADHEEVVIENEEVQAKPKTWNVPGQKGKDSDRSDGEEDSSKKEDLNHVTEDGAKEATPAAAKSKAYVPPSLRVRPLVNTAVALPNMADAMEFPTLGAADEIAQKQEQERKKIEAKKIEAAAASKPLDEKPAFDADAKAAEGKYVAPAWRQVGVGGGVTSASPTPPVDTSPLRHSTNAYVPPHLRMKAGGNVSTENRYDSLKS